MKKIKIDKYLICISIFIILISIWILNHPYKGIVHDSRLYTLQAISHINPEIFKNDLFLKYESQENYSVFSYIYSLIIKFSTPATANIFLFILGHVFWFVAAYLLVCTLMRGALKYISFVFIIAMPAFYGPQNIFSFGEPFLTPRLFAEAFVLFSIYFILKEKFALSGFILAISFILHPIVACTGAMFIYIYCFLKYPKYTIICGFILVSIVLIAALHGIQPFTKIFHKMDAEWAGIVQKHTDFLFLSNWSLRDLLPTITSFLMVLLYTIMNKDKRGIVATALISAVGISFLLSIIFGDIIKNELMLQLQIWRTSWLLLFFSYLFLPSFYVKIRKYSSFSKSFIAVYCASWLSPNFSVLTIAYLILTIIYFVIILENYKRPNSKELRFKNFIVKSLSEDFRKKQNITIIIISFSLLALDLACSFYIINELSNRSSLISLSLQSNSIISLLLLTFGIPLVYYQVVARDKSIVVVSFVVLLISFHFWDRTLDYEKILERGLGKDASSSIIEIIPKNSEVLWVGHPELSWFLANRINYVSSLQSSGIVFSRECAILTEKRMNSIGSLKDVDRPVKFYLEHESDMFSYYTDEIRKSCYEAKDLDFIISECDIPEYRPIKILSLKNIKVDWMTFILEYKKFEWYLYCCKNIKSDNLVPILR